MKGKKGGKKFLIPLLAVGVGAVVYMVLAGDDPGDPNPPTPPDERTDLPVPPNPIGGSSAGKVGVPIISLSF